MPADLGAVVDFFGLNSQALVAKDFHVVRAIRTIAALDVSPFMLVFGGGTALARAHRLVRRMSEDVDFKIVPNPGALASRNALRQHLGALRDRIAAALLAAGFAFDPSDTGACRSRNENRYTVFHLPYGDSGAAQGLRPTIQIELTFASLRLPPVALPVASFVQEAFGRTPEVPAIPCVAVEETAAEKLVSLTRRTAMDLAGLSRDPDPTLVRHIYDLYAMRAHIDPDKVSTLAREIAVADAAEFRDQFPAYATDIAGETGRAVEALRTAPVYRDRYAAFMLNMVYGDRPDFEASMATVVDLAAVTWGPTPA